MSKGQVRYSLVTAAVLVALVLGLGWQHIGQANETVTGELSPQAYLPVALKYQCIDFFDDFSNPASGWPQGDNSFETYGYLNGEYRVITKQAGYFYIYEAPLSEQFNYRIEVKARFPGTPGNSYGLVFGIEGDYDRYYLFDMNSDFQEYRLLYRYAPSQFEEVVPISSAPSIHADSATNVLVVTRLGDKIELEINGVKLGSWIRSNPVPTRVGIVVSPYSNAPQVEARFDDFSLCNRTTADEMPADPLLERPGETGTQSTWLEGLWQEYAIRAGVGE